MDIVRMAVAQHDNGWYEWEIAPKLRRRRPHGLCPRRRSRGQSGAVAARHRPGRAATSVCRRPDQRPRGAALRHLSRPRSLRPPRKRRSSVLWTTTHGRSKRCAAWADQPAMQRWLEPAHLDANITLLQFCDVARSRCRCRGSAAASSATCPWTTPAPPPT
ncbi:MAG: hypothetical protein R2838_01360 [Caldilineaceae bacterium]